MENGISKRIHFIGIGGSSMSGLALFMQNRGCIISGSDSASGHKTDKLIEHGIKVFIGHQPENVHDTDLVVYSAAIKEDNPERAEAKRLGIPQIERAVLLGRIMTLYNSAICVSGTHGKTTTTSMIAQCFYEAGRDPGVHIGGELDAIGGSTLMGNGDTFIAEACEYNGSFWNFYPTIGIITNIDEDHLDFYGNIDNIQKGFSRFAKLIPADGWCVGWGGDKRVREVMEKLTCHKRTYGLEPFNELRAENISYDEYGRAFFTATLFGHPLMDVQLQVSGEKNLLDALACIAVCSICELPMSSVAETLERFTGAKRRFELTSTTDGVNLYTDYAHNPEEMMNAISNAAAQPHKTLYAVWQPFTFSRTKDLWNGFMETFDQADVVVLTDIMGGRDKQADFPEITSEAVVKALCEKGIKAVHTPTFDDAEAYLRANWQDGDVVISMGCGNVNLLNEQIALHGDSTK